ncbi:peroxidase [Pontixanthobacter rizhaonensis]|uniref:peroxidase n=1 Tax=Pontixanthobacter rizhaonensis TaxID=2730337 RepID=UPI003CCD5BB0
MHDARQIATPADWRSGSDVIIPPSISDEEAKPLFPQGWTTLRPYLRTTRVD